MIAKSGVSLVVPCYNSEAYIAGIATVVAQVAEFGVEVLLIDDFSTDATFEKAIALGLKVIRTPRNMGPGGARNFGVQHLSSEWVHFWDADDLLSVEALRKSLACLDESVDVLLVGSHWIDEVSGKVVGEWSFTLEDLRQDSLGALLAAPVPTCCSIIRIKNFLAVGGFDSDFRCWEDGDLHLRLFAGGARLGVTDAVVTMAIRHDRGVSSNHLYCHRCRFAFLKRYVDQQLPIEPPVMANELMLIGNLLFGERCFGEALKAYKLAHRVHPICPQSNQKFVRWLMALLPPPHAILMQQWLRQTFGQYFGSWK